MDAAASSLKDFINALKSRINYFESAAGINAACVRLEREIGELEGQLKEVNSEDWSRILKVKKIEKLHLKLVEFKKL